LQSAGIQDFDPNSKEELLNIASQGLYKAIGDQDVKYLDNWKGKMDYQASLDR